MLEVWVVVATCVVAFSFLGYIAWDIKSNVLPRRAKSEALRQERMRKRV